MDKTVDTTAVAVRDPQASASVVRAEDFLPLLTVDQAVNRKIQINLFISKVLKEGQADGEGDYGVMPGASKKVLFKPGAEKLCSIFGLAPQYAEDKIVEDWTGKDHGGEPLFYYSYKCSLTRGGQFMGEAIGSANSWESKYRYRWVREEDVPVKLAPTKEDLENLLSRGGQRNVFEPDFALEKRETAGRYGKPAEYWEMFDEAISSGRAKRIEKKLGAKVYDGYALVIDEKQYRIPNPDTADVINTCQKIAQKRALVAAVLVVTNCSDAFTQDLEDLTGGAAEETTQTKPATSKPRQDPKQESKTNGKPAGVSVPAEIAEIVKRVERDKSTFPGAVALFEKALVEKFGAEEGVKRYDTIAEGFYARHPNGTQDMNELRSVLVQLHGELERPAEAVAEPAAK